MRCLALQSSSLTVIQQSKPRAVRSDGGRRPAYVAPPWVAERAGVVRPAGASVGAWSPRACAATRAAACGRLERAGGCCLAKAARRRGGHSLAHSCGNALGRRSTGTIAARRATAVPSPCQSEALVLALVLGAQDRAAARIGFSASRRRGCATAGSTCQANASAAALCLCICGGTRTAPADRLSRALSESDEPTLRSCLHCCTACCGCAASSGQQAHTPHGCKVAALVRSAPTRGGPHLQDDRRCWALAVELPAHVL